MTSVPSQPLPPSIGTDEHYRWLHGIVSAVLLINLIDAVLTLFWVGAGFAKEANPLLADLVKEHPVGFASAKLGLVGLSSLLMWRLRHRPLAVVGIFCTFLLYYLVLLHHLDFLGVIIGAWLAG